MHPHLCLSHVEGTKLLRTASNVGWNESREARSQDLDVGALLLDNLHDLVANVLPFSIAIRPQH